MNERIETLCVKDTEIRRKIDNTGSISFPIYQTATYSHLGLNKSTGYDYSRLQNPTKEGLEEIVARLENAKHCLAFSTGMASINTVFELFKKDDHILACNDLYGGTVRLFNNNLTNKGIKISYINTSNLKEIETSINENTKCIFIETPTNPLNNVSDIYEISKICKKHKILLIIDNTFLTPYFQKPLELGADIIVHSGTKYLSGHNDTLAGFIALNDTEIYERLLFIQKTIGNGISPFDAWLVIRGIKTLAVRLKQIEENSLVIANYLSTHKKIKKVYYLGLKSHKDYELNKKQSKGSGGIISFELNEIVKVEQVLNNLSLIRFAESLGGVETLITYPITQTHADVDKKILYNSGINHNFLRLSIGIEHVDDLINDLKNALGE